MAKRKEKRKLSFDKPTHLVLRLKVNILPLFDPRDLILRRQFFTLADKYNIKLYDLVLNHTHVHGSLLLQSRKSYVKFIRELTAWIVAYFSRTMGFKYRQIFAQKPFTRMVSWGRAYQILKNYFRKNEIESGVEQKALNQGFTQRQFKFVFGP